VDKLILVVGPLFAVGFAIQQLLELLDPLLTRLTGAADTGPGGRREWVFGLAALALGLGVALVTGVRTLQPLGVVNADWLDVLMTGLIITGATEAANSGIKFLVYFKEDEKAKAAVRRR
jgi:hypothetical protein